MAVAILTGGGATGGKGIFSSITFYGGSQTSGGSSSSGLTEDNGSFGQRW